MESMLVLNLGMDSVQGTFFDESGIAVAAIKRNIDLIIDEECVEQDPEQWYKALIEIISSMTRSVENIKINSITVTYKPGTFVCIDRMGNHLMNAILQCDSRAKYQARACEKSMRGYYDDYNIPWEHMILPKVLWIKYNKPDVYKNIFKILTPDSFLSYKLCGEAAIDNYSALFMGYSSKNASYNTRVFNSMGLDARLFPEVRKTGECIGIIAGDAKEALNLKENVKFILSSNILIAFSKAINWNNKNMLYDVASSSFCYAGNFFKLRRDSGLIRLPLSEDGMYLYSYMGNYEVLFTKWLNEIMELDDDSSLEHSPGSHGLLVLPYLIGQNIFNNSDLRGCIIGISRNTTKMDITSAYYESVGYILRDRVDDFLQYDVQVNSIEVLSDIKNEIFYHILSNITSKDIMFDDPRVLAARGAYCIAAQQESDDNIEKTVIIPDEEKALIYRQFYNLYRNACESFNNTFKHRRRILKRLIF